MICTNRHACYSPISFTCRRLKAWPLESTKHSLAPEDLRGDRSSPGSVFELSFVLGNFIRLVFESCLYSVWSIMNQKYQLAERQDERELGTPRDQLLRVH